MASAAIKWRKFVGGSELELFGGKLKQHMIVADRLASLGEFLFAQ